MDFYKKDYTPEDCWQGLVGAIYIYMQDPLFTSQQKIALQSERLIGKNGEPGPTIRSFINDFICKNLGNYLLIHKDIATAIENKIKQAYKLRQEIIQIRNRNKNSKVTSVYNENFAPKMRLKALMTTSNCSRPTSTGRARPHLRPSFRQNRVQHRTYNR